MSRTKEFDETEVLDQALQLFRTRGFKQTSFDDLTRELGVSRQSLYVKLRRYGLSDPGDAEPDGEAGS